jgi:predicted Zn-ribbon and HTH transcriptional regulator
MATSADGRRAFVRRPLRCSSCGYEIASYLATPPCPMCHELRWEPAPWRPFSRALKS